MGFWTLLALIATLTLIVLVGKYLADKRHEPAWDGLTKPMSVSELVREWIIFVGLFGGYPPYYTEPYGSPVGLSVGRITSRRDTS